MIKRSALLLLLLFTGLPAAQAADSVARGSVFHDQNRNGFREADEDGIANVRVSNQLVVTTTDEQGRWELPSDDDVTFFVIKPRGWMTPVTQHQLPKFYYTHKPEGSPELKYPGVEPTGPLPESIDFPLYPQEEPDKFQAIFFADPQPRDQKEINYIAHDVVEELIGHEAAFGVTLGDIMFDDLSLFGSLNATIALIGIPWYNVIGNHDINFDAADDVHSDETYERVYGPNYYSFDYGPAHFIVLDDVAWGGKEPEGSGRYTGGLGPDQVQFVKNDLALVPEEKLIVLMMHIPLVNVEDRADLYRIIEQRPYTMSISGHTHFMEHRFITREDGWQGPEPHHHVINVTVSGTWWAGAPDELGIPHTMMRDGAPNGYSIITFDGQKAAIDFKAARRPADYQLNIYAPEEVVADEAASTAVYVNVFSGSVKSKVEARVGDGGEWFELARHEENDPFYVAARKLEQTINEPPWRALNDVRPSSHLWKANLPGGLRPGVHRIEARTTDMYGRTFTADRVLRVK